MHLKLHVDVFLFFDRKSLHYDNSLSLWDYKQEVYY